MAGVYKLYDLLDVGDRKRTLFAAQGILTKLLYLYAKNNDMDIDELLEKCRENLRLIDNYYIPEKVKFAKLNAFLKEVIKFNYSQIKILDASLQSVFDVICKDLIKQCRVFIQNPDKNVIDARNLLNLILSIETYLKDISRLPWKLGRKVSFFEKIRIKRILRRKLHSAYDPKNKRPVRGTHVKIVLTGSLARGYSDWKLINGGNIPAPTDYSIPAEYLTRSKTVYKQLDEKLLLPLELKKQMSDVDILIQNEVIFDSLSKEYMFKVWGSFKLGEPYPTGLGGSPILKQLHQALQGIKIGGIRGRWVNFIVVRDEKGYNRYMADRMAEIAKVEEKSGKEIDATDVVLLDEVIQ
ncbi:hypothetical protein KY310_01780 [Candidatus Woesearchaeota archaeon]|nr:hypothetical protein [Candidatus Woesearchaeota archaeon]